MQFSRFQCNAEHLSSNLRQFVGLIHYDGAALPAFPRLFDGILSVNTVYFWAQPLAFLQNLRRVLKPTGRLSLVYMDEDYMRGLPFVGERFQVYSVSALEHMATQAGYTLLSTQDCQDQIPFKDTGKLIDRPYHVSTFALA